MSRSGPLATSQRLGAAKLSVNIILLGDSGVGKTSLIVQYIQKYFDQIYKSTIGISFWSKDVRMSGQSVALKIFDTAGQEKYSCALPGSFYRKSHCCILVYDVTNPRSFESLEKWKNDFVNHSSQRDCPHAPFIVVGNKCDDSSDRRVSETSVKLWCRTNDDCRHFETSARDSINVDKAFNTAAKLAFSYLMQHQVQESGIRLEQSHTYRPLNRNLSSSVRLDHTRPPKRKLRGGCC